MRHVVRCRSRCDCTPYRCHSVRVCSSRGGVLHQDSHRPTDDVAKLDIGKITNVSTLSFSALWLAADDASCLLWEGIVPETLWWVKPRRAATPLPHDAMDSAEIPWPSVKLDPTALTTAFLRVSPARARMRYTASMPVQCPPSKYVSPAS